MKKTLLTICTMIILVFITNIVAGASILDRKRKHIFKISINYVDENNKKIDSDMDLFSGVEGEYSFTYKEIDGYELNDNEVKTVKFTSKNDKQTITFVYKKKEIVEEEVDVEEEVVVEPVVLDFTKEKIGIALPSGGFLGSYTIGQLLYLKEIGIDVTDFDSIVGTSVGAINAVSLLSNGLDGTVDLWNDIKDKDIYEGDLSNTDCAVFNSLLDEVFVAGNNIGNLALIIRGFAGGEVSNQPLKELLNEKVNIDKVLNSNIEVGLVTLNLSKLKTVIATNRNGLLAKDTLVDYTMMSSSCYPVFPMYEYNGEKYIDGGYLDSNNGKYLFSEFNCDKAIILDLRDNSSKYATGGDIVYCCQSQDIGSFLDTKQSTIQRNIQLGYKDMKKAMENVTIIN